MKMSVLGSGSSGNCIYVENSNKGFLIDAGLSGRDIEKRLEMIGTNISNVEGIIITHDHIDHIRGAGILSRRHRIPLHIEEDSYNAAKGVLGEIPEIQFFKGESRIEISGLHVETIPTEHDAAASVCLFVRNSKKNLGVFTDLGRINDSVKGVFPFLDAAVLEFNYDIQMLENGPYPDFLKRRISGDKGHLSNNDASMFVKHFMGSQLKTLFLAHISEHNNTPDRAKETLCHAMKGCRKFDEVKVEMTSRKTPTPLISI